MTRTYDLWRFFVQFVFLKRGTKFAHRAPTYEISQPYRRSNSVVLHIWPGRGVVLGFWRASGMSEEEALRAAVEADDYDPLDPEGHLLEMFRKR